MEYRVKDFALYLLNSISSWIFDYLLDFNKRFYSFLFKLVAQKGQKTDREETSEPYNTPTSPLAQGNRSRTPSIIPNRPQTTCTCASRTVQIESGEHSGVTASRTPSGSNNAQRERPTSSNNNTPQLLFGAQSGPEMRTHSRGEPETSLHPGFRASQDEMVIDPPPSYQEVMSGSYIQIIPWNSLLITFKLEPEFTIDW